MPLLAILFLFMVSCGEEESELANAVPMAQDCESTHPLVGQSKNLSTLAHEVSGVVTIVSDCEIEISNFFYDGKGPAVRVYGGAGGNFESGVNMSEALNGRVYAGETLSFFLPEGSSLDTIDSFSIWCFLFREDFGSVIFQ